MPTKPSQLDYVVVADKKLDDFGPLVVELSERGVRVGLFSTGEEALRAASGNAATLWIVNMKLTDMSGVALLKLVRRRLPRSTVFLVGDEYSADDELVARAAGATAYVCKPPSAAWLEVFQPHCDSAKLAAGHSGGVPPPMQRKHGSTAMMRPP
jgi:DNA-binding response OmpR family regulator